MAGVSNFNWRTVSATTSGVAEAVKAIIGTNGKNVLRMLQFL